MNIYNFLASQGYKNIRLVLRSTGPYSARDSEWNYSDVPHLNYIHTKVEACTLLITKNDISNIFMQKVGPFLLPASVHISHVEATKHEYVMTILNIVIAVETTHTETGDGCETTTKYLFYHKGFIGWLVSHLAKYATRQNYHTLMSEDMPMRLQRGRLRGQGFRFELDSLAIIGFTDTLDIKANHLDGGQVLEEGNEVIIELSELSGKVDIDRYKCTVHWIDNTVWVLPMVCPHEGAELCFHVAKKSQSNSAPTATCPWHGRRLNPLVALDRRSTDYKTFNYLGVHFMTRVAKPTDSFSSHSKLILYTERPKI